VSSKKQKSYQLNVNLARDPLATRDSLIRNASSFERADVETSPGVESELLFRQLPTNAPRWSEFFRSEAALLADLQNQSCGAILIVRRPTATFALTFGQAQHHLIDEAFEERFGLLVALNSADPDRLRKVDTISLGNKGRQASVQVGTLGSFGDFGLDVDSDLVRKVAVAPSDDTLGKQLVGRRALTLSVPVAASNIEPLLDDLLVRFQAKHYRNHHQWLDNVSQVTQRSLVDALDEEALACFRGDAQHAKLWAAVPEVVEWERILDFSYSEARSAPRFVDIHVATMRTAFLRSDPSKVTIAQLRQRHVYANAPEGLSWSGYKWSFYKCIYCELTYEGESYLLTNGSWFRIGGDFVTAVRKDLDSLVAAPSVSLPDYIDSSEDAYNQRVTSLLPGTCCMDAKNIPHGGGASKIELCDIVRADGTLIFVKRFGGSKVLSHLFAQGAVSANLLAIDSSFRDKVNAKLPETHRLKEADGRLQTARHRLVFAITTRKDQPILDSLPFFSKVSLRNTLQLLRGFGYTTEVIGIRDVRVDSVAEAEAD
jgi:uncharacterized protein (TIGR04141 family)